MFWFLKASVYLLLEDYFLNLLISELERFFLLPALLFNSDIVISLNWDYTLAFHVNPNLLIIEATLSCSLNSADRFKFSSDSKSDSKSIFSSNLKLFFLFVKRLIFFLLIILFLALTVILFRIYLNLSVCLI